jgi:hypothetical protein
VVRPRNVIGRYPDCCCVCGVRESSRAAAVFRRRRLLPHTKSERGYRLLSVAHSLSEGAGSASLRCRRLRRGPCADWLNGRRKQIDEQVVRA